MNALVRLVSCAVVLVAGGLFAAVWGPRPAVVHADVYGPAVSAAGFLLPPGAGTTLGPRVPVRMNGEGFHYVAGRSRQKLGDLLDHYERQLRGDGGLQVAPRRMLGPGMGWVSGIAFGKLSTPEELRMRLFRFGETKRLSEIGRFHVVVAFAGADTSFVQFTPDDDARLDRLLGIGDGEPEGDDVAGIGRPPASRRVMGITVGAGTVLPRTNLYDVPAGAPDALSHYVGTLASRGWTLNPLSRTAGEPRIGHWVRGREECFVVAADAGERRTVAVVHRPDPAAR